MMKMRLCAALLALAMMLCGAAMAEPAEVQWKAVPQEAAELPEDAQAAFDKALEGLLGAQYTPVALLSTLEAEEMNYCILCQITPVVPNAVPNWALVYIHADDQGNAGISNVYDLSIDQYSTPED